MPPAPRTTLGKAARQAIDECRRQADEAAGVLANAQTAIEQSRDLLRRVYERLGWTPPTTDGPAK